MWFTAIAQLVGQEAQSQPLDTRNPYQTGSSSSLLIAGGLLLLVGGAAYFMLRTPRRTMGRRSRR